MKTPFEILVEHCREIHPHMESPRGQIDLRKAEQEYVALCAVAEAAKEMKHLTTATGVKNLIKSCRASNRQGCNFEDALHATLGTYRVNLNNALAQLAAVLGGKESK